MELLTTNDSWRYFIAPLDSPAETFGPFTSLVDLWREKRPVGGLPAWRDFELMDLKNWWGWLTVIDISSEDAAEHRYRLWGTRLVQAFGIEMTGKRMTDEWGGPSDARNFGIGDVELLDAVTRTPCIGIASGPIDGRFPSTLAMTTLRLPLADDGRTVDRVLSGNALREEDDPWPPH